MSPNSSLKNGPDHALGQRLADVADLLARLVEGVLDGLSAHRALQVDEDVGEAGPRVGADEIEARRFLQLALDLVDHLVLHFLGRGAGPQHLHHHDAKREVGVLLLADAQQREGARRQQQHEQERREVAVIDRPARQIEASRCVGVGQIIEHADAPTAGSLATRRASHLASQRAPACVALAREPDAHAVAQELHAGGDHHVSSLQSAGDLHAVARRRRRHQPWSCARLCSLRRRRTPLFRHRFRSAPSEAPPSARPSPRCVSATVAVMPSRMACGGAFTAMRTA